MLKSLKAPPLLCICLMVALAVGTLFSAACNADQLKKAKVAGLTIERTDDAVMALIPTFENSGEISHDDAAIAVRLLTDFKITIHQFNQTAATYTTFDEKARSDLLKLFQDVTAGLAVLNEQGVLRIKNPKLKGRVQVYLTAAQLAAGIIADALEKA